MKIVKKIFFGFIISMALLIATAVILPRFFKDDIKAAIDKELAQTVNAEVVFDPNNFSFSVFKNFPNMTIGMKEMGVFNRAPFEGVRLFEVENFEVEVNLMDVLFGNQLRVKGIRIVKPQINVQVLKDGRANYDISIPPTDTVQQTADTPNKFSFAIDHWEVEQAQVTYDDASIPFAMSIKNLNHEGSGNFNDQSFDLFTKTTTDTVNVVFDGIQYISNKSAKIDATLGISEEYTKFVFKENNAQLNDFALSMDGWIKRNTNVYDMDITFKSPENTFKSLLSLVPGVYTKDFGKIETKGELLFNGFVKGTYSEKQLPAFNLALKVKDAMFKYPNLPTPVNNIQMDLMVDNKTGVIDNTLINFKKLHLNLGSNPIDARVIIENLKNYRMDGEVKAKFNLAELTKIFPIQGLEMKGLCTIDAKAKGVYDSIQKSIPAIDASMLLEGGYVKASQVPFPLQDVRFSATAKNTSGKMPETTILVNDFNMLMDGERFNASLLLQNLQDYTWDLKAKGTVDIERMLKMFPLEGMTMTGKVKADIKTKGKYSDVTAKRYDKLPTSGAASLTNFKFNSSTLPYGVTISQAEASFNPQKIEVKNTHGTIGKSDFHTQGYISNYIGYLFGKETIKGKMTFNSTLMDLNEFTTSTAAPSSSTKTKSTSTTTETTKKDTSKMEVIAVPQNIDMILQANIKTVKMMDYVMTNANGEIAVKDGIANLKGVNFSMLGGAFGVGGTYNSRDIQHPKYDFELRIEDLLIQQASKHFSIIKTYAPIAGMITGKFGVDFKINGELGADMMPNMSKVNGAGLIKIKEAVLTKSNLVSGLSSFTKLDNAENVSMKDLLMSIIISDGRLSVKPFKIKLGDYATTITGSTGLDKSIEYDLKMIVPAAKLGSQFQNLINQYGGANGNSEITVPIKMTGTVLNPKFLLKTNEQKEQIKEAVTNVVKEKGKEVVKDLIKETPLNNVVNNIFGEKSKTDSTQTKDTTQAKPVKKILQNKLNDFFKRKKD